MVNPYYTVYMTEYADLVCKEHGLTKHYKSPKASYKCHKCNVDRVTVRRREVVRTLKEEHGGQCVLCGYSKCLGALDFHHRDPSTKEARISTGNTKSIARLRVEAAKCILVCANCHREIHMGLHPTLLNIPE